MHSSIQLSSSTVKVETAGEEFAVRALDELKKYKGPAFKKRLSEILAVKEMRKKTFLKVTLLNPLHSSFLLVLAFTF